MANLGIGNVIEATLLNADGSDGETKKVDIVDPVIETCGRFSILVVVQRGQGVAYTGQALQADFNSTKCRWQVMHPGT